MLLTGPFEEANRVGQLRGPFVAHSSRTAWVQSARVRPSRSSHSRKATAAFNTVLRPLCAVSLSGLSALCERSGRRTCHVANRVSMRRRSGSTMPARNSVVHRSIRARTGSRSGSAPAVTSRRSTNHVPSDAGSSSKVRCSSASSPEPIRAKMLDEECSRPNQSRTHFGWPSSMKRLKTGWSPLC